MNRFTPIYSRATRLVRSRRRGVGRQQGEGLDLLLLTHRWSQLHRHIMLFKSYIQRNILCH